MCTSCDDILCTNVSNSLLRRNGVIGKTYKSCCDCDHIKFVVSPIFHNNSSLVELFDGIVVDIDNINTWAIELLVVIEFEARTLYAEE